jgi:RNA polymerase-interacting CarD/CdnL/TRCF family regulator
MSYQLVYQSVTAEVTAERNGKIKGEARRSFAAFRCSLPVPVDNRRDGVGLRRAIGDAEVERLFNALGNGTIDNHQNWKGRFKDNSAKMRTGPIYEVADVPKSLHAAEPFREPCRSARKGEAPGNGASPFFLLRSPRAFRP